MSGNEPVYISLHLPMTAGMLLRELGIDARPDAISTAPGSRASSYASLDLETARVWRELNWADMDLYEQAILRRNADRSVVA